MIRIDSILEGALDKKEVLRAAKAQIALRKWPEIVGPDLATRSCPQRYERGTVWIAVEGAAWAQELRMVRHKLLDRLKRIQDEPDLFQDMRFVVSRGSIAPIEQPKPAANFTKDRSKLSIREIASSRLAVVKHDRRADP